MIEVILPVPRRDDARRPLAARPRSLRGQPLGFLDGWGDRRPDGTLTMFPLMAAIADVARTAWGVTEIVWTKKDRAGSPASAEQYEAMARCAAVVTGTCLSGGCTAGAIGDATTLEGRGVPTITLCQENFVGLATSFATSLGYPGLPLFVYPVPVHQNAAAGPEDLVRSRITTLARALLAEA